MPLIDLYVVRDDGNNQGEDIINPLIDSINSAILVGQTAIDDSESIYLVSLRTQYRPDIEHGQLIEVFDIAQGTPWKGKITNILHSKTGPEIFTELDVERPVRYFEADE